MSSSAAVNGKIFWESWDSPFGKITVSCSGQGVRELQFGVGKLRANGRANGNAKRRTGQHRAIQTTAEMIRAGDSNEPGARIARQAIAELQEYAAGRRKRFSMPLDLQGTPFQRKVWKALCAIPYGETRSYLQIARAAGNPRASRAVGMANHNNPVAIVVPCHRVIASDGTLGGYGGGLEMKAKMLQLEKSQA